MHPVSNFIIIEKYVKRRDAETWNNVVCEALADLPVEILQVTSDEGCGLVKHATKGLKAHHSSDCFHVPHEIGRGTSDALTAKVKKAQKTYETAAKQTQKEIDRKESYETQLKRPVGRPPESEKKIEIAKNLEEQAKTNVETAIENQEVVQTEKAQIGKVYHPYNIETGETQDAAKVSELLDTCFGKIRNTTGDLSDKCKKRVEKAYRVVDKMVATIAFFFRAVAVYMDEIKISESEKRLFYDYLIPGYYLQYAAQKERDKELRYKVLKKSLELLSILTESTGPFAEYAENEIERFKKAAQECAQIFQRSSSCVEGRNAQLSLLPPWNTQIK